jgi:hypothetical protein
MFNDLNPVARRKLRVSGDQLVDDVWATVCTDNTTLHFEIFFSDDFSKVCY